MYFDGGGEDSSFYSVQSGGSGGGGGYRTGALRGVEGRGSRGGAAASYSPSLSPTNSESRAAQRGLFDHHSGTGTSTSLYLASLPPLVVCVKHVCWRKKDWNFPYNFDWRPRPCSRSLALRLGMYGVR